MGKDQSDLRALGDGIDELIIRLFQTSRLPQTCDKPALIRRACRLALGPAAKRKGELNVIFTSNPEIRRINKRYLNHDYATDVVAFPYISRKIPSRGPNPPFGDIYVSVDQARIQAKQLGHSWMKELLTLAIHGTLHLMGYDDHRPADRRRMFARQDKILNKLRLKR